MDVFEGYWILDPVQNRYEYGDAPLSASYRIERINHVYRIKMEWVAANQQALEMRYEAIPDGHPYPVLDNPGVDSICTTRIGEYTLNTEACKAGVVVARAHRVISEDSQMMTVTQFGQYPDGGMYSNRAVYYRLQE
jgi:hypothetical protein